MNGYTAAAPFVLLYRPAGERASLPAAVAAWAGAVGVPVETVDTPDALMHRLRQRRPRAIVVDARTAWDDGRAAVARAKRDAYTAVVPLVLLAPPGRAADGIRAGADDVLPSDGDPGEARARLDALLQRSDRDLGAHPSTRLQGAPAIEAEIEARLGTPFAVCYADLDHFKEFNDRYSYTEGDRIIRILAALLHDSVTAFCPGEGFVGHIGGDDFIFIVPRARADEVCAAILRSFDELVPFQYSEHDRRAGYFFGKDRRGQLHRVPLMTLSIGVVTNARRTFADAATVSALATEMKTYAKTLPGSVYAIDRRTDERSQAVAASPSPTSIGAS